MFEFLGLGRSGQAVSESPKVMAPVEPVAPPVKTIDKQREMIRLAMNSVLRRNGIPSQLIGCDVTPLVRAGSPDLLEIHLAVLKWHDGLMRYAPQVQVEILKEIHLFDKKALDSGFRFVWTFAADCGYPNRKLPPAVFWTHAASLSEAAPADVTPAPVEPVPAKPKAKFDLPKSNLDDDDDRNSGFAATQIGDHL